MKPGLTTVSMVAHLCSYSVRPGGKQLGDARRLESLLGETHGSTQTRAARTNYDGVIGVVDCNASENNQWQHSRW